MRAAYSRLAFLLEERGLTPAELRQRVEAQGDAVDVKTLNRLADPDRPIKHVETRIADAICRALEVEVGDLLVFTEPLAPTLQTLPAAEQRRLDELMERHSEGRLDARGQEELQSLVEEVGRIGLANAQRLVEHRRRVRDAAERHRHTAAD